MNVLLVRVGHQAQQAHQEDVPHAIQKALNVFLSRVAGRLVLSPPEDGAATNGAGSSVDRLRLSGRVGGGQGLGHNTVATKGQVLARQADPRTTQHYDRARGNLDRHGVHFLTAYVAGV